MSAIRFPRVISALCCPMGVLLAILFFLPWVGLRCSGVEIGSASGMQLSIGNLSESEAVAKQQAQTEDEEGNPKPKVEIKPFIQARPWFFLGLAVPGLILLSALAGCRPVALHPPRLGPGRRGDPRAARQHPGDERGLQR